MDSIHSKYIVLGDLKATTPDMDKVTDQVSEKVGWDTKERSKSFAIDTLSRALEDSKCIPHSVETYEELRTFVHGERGKLVGQQGKHDDRVMALSLANIAARQAGIGEMLVV
jgi:hypothetical protein